MEFIWIKLNCGAGEESWGPLEYKEIKPVKPKGNQPCLFIGRTDAEVETPILWPPDVKNWLTGKDPDAGKDLRWEEKGMTEDEMVGWHHWLNGHEFEYALRVGDGQGSLVCCIPLGRNESDTTKWLNLLNLSLFFLVDQHLFRSHPETHLTVASLERKTLQSSRRFTSVSGDLCQELGSKT